MKKNPLILIIAIAVIVVGALIYFAVQENNTPGKYDDFARCLGEKGAVFYGAFWCPHCQAQKKLFGTSAKLLPYVECSTLDGNGQTPECIEKKVASYPTWEFADLSRLTREIPLAQLAEKTTCVLPE